MFIYFSDVPNCWMYNKCGVRFNMYILVKWHARSSTFCDERVKFDTRCICIMNLQLDLWLPLGAN